MQTEFPVTIPEHIKQHMVDIPPGKSGDWEVLKFTINEKQAEMSILRSLLNPSRGSRYARIGEFTMLTHHGEIIMSDTVDEIVDHWAPIKHVKTFRGGHCLVNGLGIGMVTDALLRGGAEHVTVVELDADVIALVGPYYQKKWGDRLTIVHADALTWKAPKGQKYSVVWHDIWPTICEDNLPQMHKLHRKYGGRCEWQGSWARGLVQKLHDRTDAEVFGF